MLGDLRHFGDLVRRNAGLFPGEPSLASLDERYTWRETYGRSLRLANGFRDLGLEPGARVAILATNSIAYAELFFALAGAGLVTVPLNYRLSEENLRQNLEDSGAAALVFSQTFTDLASSLVATVDGLEHGVAIGLGLPSSTHSTDQMLAQTNEDEAGFRGPSSWTEPVLILYTSGTTGLPKGVVYSHQTALWSNLIHVLAIGSAHHHRVLLPSPLFSAAGFAGISCAVAVGSPTFILQFELDTALEVLERERITFTNLVPTTVRMLLEHERIGQTDLSALEVLLYGGSPMREDTLRAADERLTCGFRQTFATSETGLAGTVLEPQEHRRALDDSAFLHRLTSCGRPQVGVGVRLTAGGTGRDAGNEPVPPGEIGEVEVACPGNMLGYWNRPQATAETLRDGWLRTGDLARRDADGFFYLVDRKHDMIVSGALNIYPTEIERVFATHPDVADCAVIGVPHPDWGEAVKALVVPRAGSTPDEAELIEFARQHLARFKVPKTIETIDAVPYNPAGKPLRRQLREPFWKDQKRTIG